VRTVIVILILIILVLLLAIGTGFVDINQIRGAKAPAISGNRSGVTAKGGQAPAFEVETGSVEVGTKNTTVKVPSLSVNRPGAQPQNEVAENSVNAM
jgi:hypothetical protein